MTCTESGLRRGGAALVTPGAARLLPVLLAVVLAALAVLAGAGSAGAHAALTGSDPQQDSVVEQAPKEVSLTFSEQIAVDEDAIRVLDPSGNRVDTEEAPRSLGSGGAQYAVKLRAGLPDGTFTVAYQVVSADSHPVAGAFTFSIGAPSETSASVPDQASGGGAVGTLYGIARYLSYAGFTLLVGGAAFVLACWPGGARVRPMQRLVAFSWVGLTAATLAMLLLRGPYAGSGKLADIFDLGVLGGVLETKTGAALVSRLLLLAAAALFVAVLFGAYAGRENAEERRDLTFGLAIGGTAVAVGLAATWAMSEHASTGIQAGIAMPVDVLHLLAVAAWFGGLTALLLALYRAPSVERSAVRRFSGVAFASVVVLALTGLYQSWRQVGSWSALTGTSYGQLLLVKVGLVALLVAVAGLSRQWTRRLGEASETTGPPGPAAGHGAPPEAAAPVAGSSGADAGRRTPGVAADGSRPDADSGERTETRAVTAGSSSHPEGRTAVVQGEGADDATPGEARPAAEARVPVQADPVREAQLRRQREAATSAARKKRRDGDRERSGLRRSVLVEAGVAVVVLAVTTVLTTTEPGRTEEEAAAGTSASAAQQQGPVSLNVPFDTGGKDGKGTVLLDVDPGRSGDNALHVYLQGPDKEPLDVPEVKVALTLKAQDLGPLTAPLERISAGHWSAAGVQIPLAGRWTVAVTVRTSDIDQVTVSKNARIG
ncbi:copper resistance CopC/CopD family protein [Streptomyces diastaticus]|uniref:copper resistance CopC/CopD family protein n=1 Tax=Streptomyces diastaticus TaxID=1956 RepID=UPI0035DAF71C